MIHVCCLTQFHSVAAGCTTPGLSFPELQHLFKLKPVAPLEMATAPIIRIGSGPFLMRCRHAFPILAIPNGLPTQRCIGIPERSAAHQNPMVQHHR